MNDRELDGLPQADQIDYLKSEVKNLRSLIADLTGRGKYNFPDFPNIRPGALRILEALLERPHISTEALHAAIYGHRYDQPMESIISVWVCHVRRLLKRYGCEVKNTRGIGYYIPPDQRDHLRRLFAKSDERTT